MEYKEFIDQIATKYGYSEDLKKAISLTIPLMIRKYGADNEKSILGLFENVRIFATGDMSEKNRMAIENEMTQGLNSHVVYEEANIYKNDRDPGSYYCYQAIYDNDMNVTGEVRWLGVKDLSDTIGGEKAKNLFGTSINMPYFIHEIGHAFAMQNPLYRTEGNEIYSKHGMYESVNKFTVQDDKVQLKIGRSDTVLLEEMINEKDTQDMLVDLLQVSNYNEVMQKLNEIDHVSTSYSPCLIAFANKLENVMGQDKILKFRRDNQQIIMEEFNHTVAQSDIAKKYFPNEEAYSYLANKAFETFELTNKCYTMPIEEYYKASTKLMIDGLMPLCAYGGMSLENFDTIKRELLGEEQYGQQSDFSAGSK